MAKKQPPKCINRQPRALKRFPFEQAQHSSPASESTCVVSVRAYFDTGFRGNVEDVKKAISVGLANSWNSAHVLGTLENGAKVMRNSDGTPRGVEVKLFSDLSREDIVDKGLQCLSQCINLEGRWCLPASAHYPAPIQCAVLLEGSSQPMYHNCVLHPFPPSIDLEELKKFYSGKDDVFYGARVVDPLYEVDSCGMDLLDTVRMTIMGCDGGFPCAPPSALHLPGFRSIGVHLVMKRVPELPPCGAPATTVSAMPAVAHDNPPSPPPHASPPTTSATSTSTSSTSTTASAPSPSPVLDAGDVVPTVRGDTPSTSAGGSMEPPSGEDQPMPPAPLTGYKRPASPSSDVHSESSGSDEASTSSAI